MSSLLKKVIFFIFLFLFKVKENLAIYRQDVGSDGVSSNINLIHD